MAPFGMIFLLANLGEDTSLICTIPLLERPRLCARLDVFEHDFVRCWRYEWEEDT